MSKKNKEKISIGFTKNSENWNGRIAMVSFIIIVITELLTKQPILSLFQLA
nr:Ycf17 [Sahlingia subintegra]